MNASYHRMYASVWPRPGFLLQLVYFTEWAVKTDPSDYVVYTVSAHVYQYKQCRILIVSFYTR